MDTEVNKLLTEWNLRHLCYTFFTKGVNYEKFCHLNDDDIDSIIQDKNSRTLFKEVYEFFKLSIILDPSDESLLENHVIESENVTARDLSEEIEHEKNTCNDESDAETLTEEYIIPYEANLENLRNYEHKYINTIRNKRLYKLLNDSRCIWGNIILWRYAFFQDLENLRKKLCTIIINNEFSLNKNSVNPFDISTKRFKELNCEILELFPTEPQKLYYEQSKRDLRKKKPGTNTTSVVTRTETSGILYRDYLHQRTDFHLVELLQQKKNTNRSLPSESNALVQPVLIDIDLLIKPLENNEDVPEIKKQWLESFEFRTIEFSNLGFEILNKLKVLQSEICPVLVELDFVKKFELTDTFDLISKQWLQIFDSIIVFVKDKNKIVLDNKEDVTDNNLQLDPVTFPIVFKKIYSLLKEENSRLKSAFALFCLPWMSDYTYPKTSLPKDSTLLTSSKSIKSNSFMRHILNHNDLDELIEKVDDEYKEAKITTAQPYIVCCGPLKSLTCYHAVIKKHVYEFDSLLKALDFLIKFMNVFNLVYPYSCSYVYTFIHRVIYKIDSNRNTVAKRKIDEIGSKINVLSKKPRLIVL